jgi:uncharacterized membrane protein
MTTEESNSKKGVPSTVSIGRHPLHPAVVDFPIVFLTSALVTDILFWWTGDAHWAEFSFWLILAGWITGMMAILTGLIDFLTIERARSHRAGWFHFLLTDLAIFLSTFNVISRLNDRQDSLLFTGLGLSAVVAVLLLIAGFFGGQLVFRYLVGVYGREEES